MKVGVFGKGRLGGAIAASAPEVVAWSVGRSGPPETPVDVAVDASSGDAVAAHLAWALERGVDLVIGATGWDPKGISERVAGRIGVVLAPNFSLTVAFVARLATLLGRYAAADPRFDPYLVEHHHARKKDAPSGTAKLLAEALVRACPSKRGWTVPSEGAAVPPDRLCVGVVRGGSTYSSHTIGLDAPEEVLELRHEARGPAAYAAGALAACRWIRGRKGVFTMDDVARDLLDPVFKAGGP